MRALSFAALIVGVVLIPTAFGLAKFDHDRQVSQLERTLVAETNEHGGALESYVARARAIVLLTANSPAFGNVLEEPGTRAQKVRRQSRSIREVTEQLGYLEQLYPASIGEACFIDANGEEFARVVRGEIAPADDLSTTEEQAPFFAPTFALRFGQAHPDRAVHLPGHQGVGDRQRGADPAGGRPQARIRALRGHGRELPPCDGRRRGASARDRRPDRPGRDRRRDATACRRAARRPARCRFAELAHRAGRAGITELDGHKIAYRRVRSDTGNANDWLVVASAKAPAGGLISGLGPAALAMLAVALVIVLLAGVSLRAARRELESQATTDGLTGLGNRRKLFVDLERRVAAARASEPIVLTLFDLNGFKNYNDAFGHPAGDALLLRLGTRSGRGGQPVRRPRLPARRRRVLRHRRRHEPAHDRAGRVPRAVGDSGEGFAVSAAFGSVVIPQDTGDATEAMRKADEAMYAQKYSGRATAGRQSSDVLLRALAERHPDLGDHLDGVAELVGEVAVRLGIDGEELNQLRHAAGLHDVGKVAIPDAIITKPAKLTTEEWAFMRRHTLIGERIVAAAPALGAAARLVRSSHEAFDGSGYPDGLAGVEIPLGARIIAVCDAFDAMISQRPYSPAKTTAEALAEVRRCSGSQFDPEIVAVFEQVLSDRAQLPVA